MHLRLKILKRERAQGGTIYGFNAKRLILMDYIVVYHHHHLSSVSHHCCRSQIWQVFSQYQSFPCERVYT